MPATITGSFQGAGGGVSIIAGGVVGLLLVSILVIYLILGILYESFIHPLTILSWTALGWLRRVVDAGDFRD